MLQVINLTVYLLDATSPFNAIVGAMEDEEYSNPCKMHTAKSKRTTFIIRIENLLEIKLIEVLHFNCYEMINIFKKLNILEIACSYLTNRV